MVAITDLFNRASNGTAPVPTTLSAQKSVAAASLSLSTATGWPTTTALHFKLYRTDTSGAIVSGTETIWKGTLSGTTVSNLTLKSGTDQVYAAGSIAEMMPTSAWADDLMTGLVVDHDQLGHHKSLSDSNGLTWFGQTATASAVNYWNNTNAATSGKPILKAQGTDSNVSGSIVSKGTGVIDIDGAVPVKFIAIYDFVESGIVITGDSLGVNKNYSITSGFVWIAGKRLSVAAVSAQTVGASKDRYIDLRDNGDGTAVYITNEVANNAASQALTAGDVRVGIVVAGATFITNAGSINQGEESKVLPIASSRPYAVTDSLGNLICPRDPQRRLLGYRQILVNFTTTSGSAVEITGLSCPVIIPTGRKVKVTFYTGLINSNSATATSLVQLYSGASIGTLTTVINQANYDQHATVSENIPMLVEALTTQSSSTVFFTAAATSNGAATLTITSTSTIPAWIKVELS